MKYIIKAPPTETGTFKKDVPMLFKWCLELHRKLQAMFSCIESDQIKGLDASKLQSNILTIEDDYFRLGNKTDYIEFKNGVLSVVSSSTTTSE